VLPPALERVRRKLAGSNDGDRQMVAVLAAVLTDGLPAVEAACAQAMTDGVHSSDVIIDILARRRDPGPAATILTPEALTLRHAPVAAGPLQMGPDTITSVAHDHGADRPPRHDDHPQALRDEECRSLPAGRRSQTRGTRSSPPRSSASMSRNASPAIC